MTDELDAVDTPPLVWVDEHPQATPEEIEEGNHLGLIIDPDDDDDNGGVE